MRPINFNAGPAALPEVVLKTIRNDFPDWHNTGVSMLELGHRTAEFAALNDKLEESVRRILKVPQEFAVLFLPGGAQIQFSMMVMNLTQGFASANYVDTGYWSSSAIKEAQKLTKVHVAASSAEQKYTSIPDLNSWDIKKESAFLHFTDNETIGGVEFPIIPDLGDTVLVSDMSSNIFSREIDFKRMGCVYACAQKNLGIAGVTLVIVRRDLLDRVRPETPSVFNYAVQDKNKSLLATPPTFAIYVASLVLDWIESEGGLAMMTQRNAEKAQCLYNYLDKSSFYTNPVDKKYRSRMNVPFTLGDESLESMFFTEAEQNDLLYLQGHRSVGGARASIYNAISLSQVNILIDFLRFFCNSRNIL